MIFYWKKRGGIKKHFKSILINSIGFSVTLMVFIIVFLSKFSHGAWILAPIIFSIIFTMKKIKKHYLRTEKELEIKQIEASPDSLKKIVMVLLVSKIDKRAIEAVDFIKGFHPDTTQAFHIAFEKEAGEKLEKEWNKLFPDIPIIVLTNEFRETIPSILEYFANLTQQWRGEIVAVVPMIITTNYLTEYLHNKVSRKIIEAIREDERNDVKILEVPIKI
jgi:amino acid permease